MTKENIELKSEILRQKQPTITNNEIDCGNVKQSIRPVSMYETREGIKCDMIQNVQVRKKYILAYLLHNVFLQKHHIKAMVQHIKQCIFIIIKIILNIY